MIEIDEVKQSLEIPGNDNDNAYAMPLNKGSIIL